MGKSIKGKELGVGISQRKDGLYTGRFTDAYGKRHQKYFAELQDCRRWMTEAQFKREHGMPEALEEMSVNAWFEYWLNEIKGKNIRISTRRNYEDRYRHNIRNVIGDMPLGKVKPLNCQHVLNLMIGRYKRSSISYTRTVMYCIFAAAVENELIPKNPVTKAVKCVGGEESPQRQILTQETRRLFLEAAKGSRFYAQYAFVLQTGLRYGELTALAWEDIDIRKEMLHVRHSMYFDHKDKRWILGAPKSRAGIRDIPLTQEAVDILKAQKEKARRRSTVVMKFANLVFLGGDGKPIQLSAYNRDMEKECGKAGIARISMHCLRHTFATQCIECGMKPKTLQTILGHSNIGMTMDLYVHVTEEEKLREMNLVEERFLLAR